MREQVTEDGRLLLDSAPRESGRGKYFHRVTHQEEKKAHPLLERAQEDR